MTQSLPVRPKPLARLLPAIFCVAIGLLTVAASPDKPADFKLRQAYQRLNFSHQYPTNSAQFIQAQLQDAKQPLVVMAELARDQRGPVRLLLAMLLGEYGESDGAKILWPLTCDALESVRLTAAGALIRLSQLTDIPIDPVGLDDDRATVRRLTASTLAGIKDKAAESGLLAHVAKENNELVQADIIKALEKNICGTDRSLPPLLKLAQNPSVEVRTATARVLGSYHDPIVVDTLVHTLKDSDWHVRAAAALSLNGWVKEKPDVINALVEVLDNDIFALMRDRAADALSPVASDEKVAAALVKAIGSAERDGRFHAMQAIISAKAANTLSLLKELRTNSNPEVRATVLDIFGQIGGMDQIPYIVEATADSEPHVQLAAVTALHRLKDRGGFRPLLAKLDDKDPHVRAAAARAVGDMGDKSAVVKLLPLVHDPDGYVHDAAAVALGKLGDRSAVTPLLQILNGRDWTNETSKGLIIGSSGLGFTAGWQLTANQTRTRAAQALGILQAPEAVDPLIESLKDKDPTFRSAVATALGQIRSPKAVDPLQDAILPYYLTIAPTNSGFVIYDGAVKISDEHRRETEKDANVRASIVWALGQIADPKARETLQKAINDQNSLVRDAAVEAIARILEKQELEAFTASTNADKSAPTKRR